MNIIHVKWCPKIIFSDYNCFCFIVLQPRIKVDCLSYLGRNQVSYDLRKHETQKLDCLLGEHWDIVADDHFIVRKICFSVGKYSSAGIGPMKLKCQLQLMEGTYLKRAVGLAATYREIALLDLLPSTNSEQSTSSDEPSTVHSQPIQNVQSTPIPSKKQKKVVAWHCMVCNHVFGDTNDPHYDSEWIKCRTCSGWIHLICAEEDSYCSNCYSYVQDD